MKRFLVALIVLLVIGILILLHRIGAMATFMQSQPQPKQEKQMIHFL